MILVMEVTHLYEALDFSSTYSPPRFRVLAQGPIAMLTLDLPPGAKEPFTKGTKLVVEIKKMEPPSRFNADGLEHPGTRPGHPDDMT